MGAVMGSKQLKAVVARGRVYKIVPQDPAAFDKVKQKALQYINRNRYTSDLYRNYGTNAGTLPGNAAGFLPIRNFSRGSDARAADISGQAMRERYQTRYATCKPCSILCGHQGTYPGGSVRHIPEYETVGLLGMSLGIFDTDRISEWNDICCEMGMDTISAGSTLAWVMEAGAKGLIDTDLAFGSPAGVSEALRAIAERRGQGDDLANGVRRLSEKYGGRDFAIHVKGLEMAAYDPRAAWGQGLSYAVANRGGCHLSAYLIALEVLEHLLNPHSTRAKPEFTRFFESLTAGINSLHTCQFTMYAYTLEPLLTKYTPNPILGRMMQYLPRIALVLTDFSVYPRLWSSVTGIRMSGRKFMEAGDRIHVLERYLNTREGISRKDDVLPPRLMKERQGDDDRNQPVPIELMLDRYYRIRGYDRNGVPTARTMEKLGLAPKRATGLSGSVPAYREVRPRTSLLKRWYLATMLWFVGRAVQAASRVDREVKAEIDRLPDGFCFALGVAPSGPRMIVGKDRRGRAKYLGWNPAGKRIDLTLTIKHQEAALLLFTFQEGTALSGCRNRQVVDGDLTAACTVVRVLNAVQVYLLPKPLAKLAVKRYPDWTGRRKILGRLRIYWRTLLGY
jgi:aldehyde:ferredoxin oxidoreductase